jgi:hypothetical protein
MLKHIFTLGLLGGAVAAVACSSGSSSSSTGAGGTSTGSMSTATSVTTSTGGAGNAFSCDEKTSQGHVCEEYDNLPSSLLTAEQKACASGGGTAGTACPSANRLGVCAVTTGGLMYHVSYYSDVGNVTAAGAQTACTSGGGTWTAG